MADFHSGENARRGGLAAVRRVLDQYPDLPEKQRKVILRDIPCVAAARAMGGDEVTIKDRYTEDLESGGRHTLDRALEAFRKAYDAFDHAVYSERMVIDKAYTTIAKHTGVSVKDLRNAVDELQRRAANTSLRRPATANAWPSEKWLRSPERDSRKQGALFAFLRRVWKPFVEETGAVVTRAMLAEIDPPASAALKNALRAGPLPSDIGIVATRELKKTAAHAPVVFQHHHDMR